MWVIYWWARNSRSWKYRHGSVILFCASPSITACTSDFWDARHVLNGVINTAHHFAHHLFMIYRRRVVAIVIIHGVGICCLVDRSSWRRDRLVPTYLVLNRWIICLYKMRNIWGNMFIHKELVWLKRLIMPCIWVVTMPRCRQRLVVDRTSCGYATQFWARLIRSTRYDLGQDRATFMRHMRPDWWMRSTLLFLNGGQH